MTEPMLIQKLDANLRYLTERQSVLAENIANIDTPGYKAQDLKPVNFNEMAEASAGRLEMRTSSGKHLSGTLNSGQNLFSTVRENGIEKKPLGNTVQLEDQMGKISDIGAQHQLTTTLIHKYNQLYRTALETHS